MNQYPTVPSRATAILQELKHLGVFDRKEKKGDHARYIVRGGHGHDPRENALRQMGAEATSRDALREIEVINLIARDENIKKAGSGAIRRRVLTEIVEVPIGGIDTNQGEVEEMAKSIANEDTSPAERNATDREALEKTALVEHEVISQGALKVDANVATNQ